MTHKANKTSARPVFPLAMSFGLVASITVIGGVCGIPYVLNHNKWNADTDGQLASQNLTDTTKKGFLNRPFSENLNCGSLGLGREFYASSNTNSVTASLYRACVNPDWSTTVTPVQASAALARKP